jgi:hypothetical protein
VLWALTQPVLTVTVMTAGLSIFVKLPAQKTHPTSYSPVMLAADLALGGQEGFYQPAQYHCENEIGRESRFLSERIRS